MMSKEERILHKVEKAGVKKALREGHMLTHAELLELKVQILPSYLRWLMGSGSVISGLVSWFCLENEMMIAGSVLAVVSVLMLAFAILGVGKTRETVAEKTTYELLDVVLKNISEVLGRLDPF